jgi:hypothetical protein
VALAAGPESCREIGAHAGVSATLTTPSARSAIRR